jgi:hypothetical protein
MFFIGTIIDTYPPMATRSEIAGYGSNPSFALEDSPPENPGAVIIIQNLSQSFSCYHV